MFLEKDGITIEAFHPADILRYKRAGFAEVVPENEPDEEQAGDLDEMNVQELKAEAKARGLSGYSTMSKDDLIALLKGE